MDFVSLNKQDDDRGADILSKRLHQLVQELVVVIGSIGERYHQDYGIDFGIFSLESRINAHLLQDLSLNLV